MLNHPSTTPRPYSCVNRTTFVKYMRSVKKVTLKLIETFADKCDDPTLIATRFVPAMMDPVLGDYARAVPDARCVEVWAGYGRVWGGCGRGIGAVQVMATRRHAALLSMFAAIINRFKTLTDNATFRIFPDPGLCPPATNDSQER